MNRKLKILASGGGTGGHIYPAVSIVEAIKKIYPDAEVLFVGAKGKMEMEKVPALGYEIIGLPIAGFQRSLNLKNILKNLMLPFKIVWSMVKMIMVIDKFKPDVAIGTGGYASGPCIKMAQWLGVRTYIQEQNSLPGYTNRILGLKANGVFTSFEESEKYFPKGKSIYKGNAIRMSFSQSLVSKEEGVDFFGFDKNKKIVFITGGSLGARAINDGIAAGIEEFKEKNIQLIWQCGKMYLPKYKKYESNTVKVFDFIPNIQMAYAAADIIVSRAGGALFEMFVIGKPLIALPSPYVAEDHQTANAKSLMDKNAAIMLTDNESVERLDNTIINLLEDEKQMTELSEQIKKLAKPNASKEIAEYILKDINENRATK